MEFTSDHKSLDPEDEDFLESNKMNAINGLVYGNLHGISMVTGQKINWYLLSLGTEVDMHNVHFHGQTVLSVSLKLFFKSIICSLFTYSVPREMYLSVFPFLQRTAKDHREDVIDLFPGVFMTVKMTPDSIGTWLLHCHVNDHMIHGMQALYSVTGVYIIDQVWVRGRGGRRLALTHRETKKQSSSYDSL